MPFTSLILIQQAILQPRAALHRQFCVGDVLDPGTPHRTWTLPAIVKRMQAAYCGTLTAELNHLATRYNSVSLDAIARPVTASATCVDYNSPLIVVLQLLPILVLHALC